MLLKIGQLAARSGVTARTIRFYEAAGVLSPPARGPNGYRLYGADAAERLAFVKQAAGLGLTLAEIREIVAIRQGGRPPCAHVHQLLLAKRRELDRKLRDLLAVRKRVRQSVAAWTRVRGGAAAVCPHIELAGVRGPDRRRGDARRGGPSAPAAVRGRAVPGAGGEPRRGRVDEG